MRSHYGYSPARRAYCLIPLLLLGCTAERPQKVEAPADAEKSTTPVEPSAAPVEAQTPATAPPVETAAAPVLPVVMPEVLMTDAEAALCKVKVGDQFPDLQLPNLEGQPTQLSSLLGDKLTVVVFWTSSKPMSRAQLADMGPDVAAPLSGRGVQVVGVAVGDTPAAAQAQAATAGVSFPMLVDQDGGAFAQVGSEKLPRTYLLDPTGKVLWFDIDYSRATRRELQTGLQLVLGREAT